MKEESVLINVARAFIAAHLDVTYEGGLLMTGKKAVLLIL